jgi:GT2 family glycosyltransferase
MTADKPDLTVVIPTYRRAASLARTIDSLLASLGEATPAVELLVVDQGEEEPAEHTAARAALGDRYRHFWVTPPSLPAARNFAIDHARTELIVFLDDDVLVSPGLVETYRAAFGDSRVGAVAGRVLGPDAEGPATSSGPYRLLPYGASRGGFDLDERGWVYTVQGCNMGLRRSVVASIGKFDTVFRGNALREETDVCRRLHQAGWGIRYVPGAVVRHLHEPEGGCRGDRSLSEQPELYHNEVVFFLRHRSLPWTVPFLGYLFLHHVLDPEAVRGGRVPPRARAYAQGVSQGLRHALRPPPPTQARPRHG